MASVRVRCRPNGPLVVEGAIELIDSQGNLVPIDPAKPNVALCRCGRSGNKPFCDGSHKRTGWQETVPEPAEPSI